MNSATLQKTTFKRLIGTYQGTVKGPTLIFVGGIHGNEPSGVKALKKVLHGLQKAQPHFKGKMIALAGNLKALEEGVRFMEVDLNRQFTKEKVAQLNDTDTPLPDVEEQKELLAVLEGILEREKGPFYFFDLHTTSAETMPFLTVNDSLLNRKFTKQYPLPIVLGIEEYLEGPLLSYINELGYVAFGFEGGQHTAAKALENHCAFIYLSLVFAGCLEVETEAFWHYYGHLANETLENQRFYEIVYRQGIEADQDFAMELGFKNFEPIRKGQIVAHTDEEPLASPFSGKIFMPLYQGKGDDGFFVIQKIPRFFLWLSKWLRNVRLDHTLVWLPGVQWQDNSKEALMVNLKIARFFTKPFFHLLGYRSQKRDAKQLIAKNRERASKKKMYPTQSWGKWRP